MEQELGPQDIKWLIREFIAMSDYHIVQRQKDSLCYAIGLALNHSLMDKELAISQLETCKNIIDFMIDDIKKMIEEKKQREAKKNQPIQEELPNVKNETANGNS